VESRSGTQALDPPTSPSLPSVGNRIWVLVGAVLLGGLAGFLIGSGRSGVAELEGRAAVGDHVATIESGGWSYGLSQSVAWIDESGTFHEGGWPECLGPPGTRPNVRSGAVAVPSLVIRAVVFVDCSDG
jgi:hypothetical protein